MTPDTDPLAALQRRIDAQAALIELLTAETPGKPPPCVNHDILDLIHSVMVTMRSKGKHYTGAPDYLKATRESECIEFSDPEYEDEVDPVHFEIVVRRIDERSSADQTPSAAPKPSSPLSEIFDALRKAGGDAWDAIEDVEKYLGRKSP